MRELRVQHRGRPYCVLSTVVTLSTVVNLSTVTMVGVNVSTVDNLSSVETVSGVTNLSDQLDCGPVAVYPLIPRSSSVFEELTHAPDPVGLACAGVAVLLANQLNGQLPGQAVQDSLDVPLGKSVVPSDLVIAASDGSGVWSPAARFQRF